MKRGFYFPLGRLSRLHRDIEFFLYNICNGINMRFSIFQPRYFIPWTSKRVLTYCSWLEESYNCEEPTQKTLEIQIRLSYLKSVYREIRLKEVLVLWVSGHSGKFYNERTNEAAKRVLVVFILLRALLRLLRCLFILCLSMFSLLQNL